MGKTRDWILKSQTKNRREGERGWINSGRREKRKHDRATRGPTGALTKGERDDY